MQGKRLQGGWGNYRGDRVCRGSVIIWSKFDTPTTRNLDAEVSQDGGDERNVPEEGEAAGPYQTARIWKGRHCRLLRGLGQGGVEDESRRESRKGVGFRAKCSWAAFTESARIQETYRRNRFRSSWTGRTEASLEVYVEVDGRSLTRACKDL